MAKLHIPENLKDWIKARERYRLSHAQVQMARELGMNPRKLGGMANHDQEQWKMPLPQYIEYLYEKRFGRSLPEVVLSIEDRVKQDLQKKEAHRQRKKQRGVVTAIAWYDPQQWERLKDTSDDFERLDDTYDEWLQSVEKWQAQAEARGMKVIRMPLDVDEVEQWCRQKGIPFDAASRSEYVASHIDEYVRNQQSDDVPF